MISVSIEIESISSAVFLELVTKSLEMARDAVSRGEEIEVGMNGESGDGKSKATVRVARKGG